MAGWGEMNLGRFRNALDARKQGQAALEHGQEMLMRPAEGFANMMFQGTQNEQQRQLQRDLPDIQARGAANEEEWKAENRFDRLGLRRNQAAAPSLAVPPAVVQPPATTPPTGFVPETFNLPSTPRARMAEEWSKRERPSEYGGDAYRQFMEQNKVSPSNFENIIPENLRGGATEENEAALASNAGRPYGVTVDQSAMAGARSPRPRDILPEQLKRPDTVVGPDKMAADVLPDQFKAPAKPAATAFRDTEPGQRYSDGRPEGWGKDVEEYDVDKKVREASETERYAVLRRQVAKDHPDWDRAKIDSTAERLYLGYYYGQQGSGGSDKDKPDEARLFNYAMSIKEMAKQEPGIKELLNADGTIKQGQEENYYKQVSDMASRMLPTAFKRGEFSRQEFNAVFDIINPSDPKSREQANKFFTDLYKNQAVPANVSKTTGSGGGLWGTAFDISLVNPIAKAITASKMGNENSDKMWAEFGQANISPTDMGQWINQYLIDHGYKPLQPAEKEKVVRGTKSFWDKLQAGELQEGEY